MGAVTDVTDTVALIVSVVGRQCRRKTESVVINASVRHS